MWGENMLDEALVGKEEGVEEKDFSEELKEKYAEPIREKQREKESVEGDDLIIKVKKFGILEDDSLPTVVLSQIEEAVQRYNDIMDKAVFGEKDIEKESLKWWERPYHAVLKGVNKKTADNYLSRRKAEVGKEILNGKIEQLGKARDYFTSKIVRLNAELGGRIDERARQRTTFDIANTLRIREGERIKKLGNDTKDLYSDLSKSEQLEDSEAQVLCEIIEGMINEKEKEFEEAEDRFYAGVSNMHVSKESVEISEHIIHQTKFVKNQMRNYKRAVDKQERRLKAYVDMLTRNPLAIDSNYIVDINKQLEETDSLIEKLSKLTGVKKTIIESVPKAKEPMSSVAEAEIKSNDEFYRKSSIDIEKLNTQASKTAEEYKTRRINRINQQL